MRFVELGRFSINLDAVRLVVWIRPSGGDAIAARIEFIGGAYTEDAALLLQRGKDPEEFARFLHFWQTQMGEP